ncbi:hypothetical protein HMPREF9075_00387 [Capnocytophaga sp. oral taxon 332 str. F0381]|nr:hypothetical protein HMPREF9075_00387 [Capnocytophaga sp. oral taxon 332 str. F0381]
MTKVSWRAGAAEYVKPMRLAPKDKNNCFWHYLCVLKRKEKQ